MGEVAGEGMTKGRSEVEKQRGKVGQGGRGVFLEGVRWDNADGILFLISEIDCAYWTKRGLGERLGASCSLCYLRWGAGEQGDRGHGECRGVERGLTG